jgi:hypothetical protein
MKKVLLLIVTAGIYTFSYTNLQAQAPINKIWDKTFGGADIDHLYAGTKTSDGGYIFGGGSGSGVGGDKTQPFVGGNSDIWIVKIDADGNKEWDKSFGSINSDALWSIKQTTDGGYLVGGTTQGTGISGDKSQVGYGSGDYWVIKLDSSGNKLWDKTFGGSGTENLRALVQTADGGYILGGYSSSGISGDKSQPNKGSITLTTSDLWIIKINANGNKIWDKTIGGTSQDALADLTLASDGGLIIGGYSQSNIGGDKTQPSRGLSDYWIVKTDATGNKVWDKTFGGSDNDFITCIRQTATGNFFIGGYSNSGAGGDKTQPSKGFEDYWFLKLDSLGNKIWDKSFGTSATDVIRDFVEVPGGGFLIAGYTAANINGDKSQISNGGADIWILKLDLNGMKVWDHSFGGNNDDWPADIYFSPDGSFLIAAESASGISSDKSQPCRGITDHWVIKVGNTVTGVLEERSPLSFSVFPNPANGQLRIQFNNLKTDKAEVTLRDLTGREVYREVINVSDSGLQEVFLSTSAKGMYLLQLKANDQTTTQKIILE